MTFINASTARADFFNLLDKVYLEDKSFIIKRGGVAVAEISRPKKAPKEKSILDFAGIWKNLDYADDMIAEIYALRSDKNRPART